MRSSRPSLPRPVPPPPPVAHQRHAERGAAFAIILLALLVVAVLYFVSFGGQVVVREAKTGRTAIDKGRDVACASNRDTIERALRFYEASHGEPPPSLAALENDGVPIPGCPEGGRYRLEDELVMCSKHP